jgi:sporulation protein YlmC with PRC-barrel domain
MASITSDDILGKMAVDKVGDIIGIITQLHIDKETKLITGITIDQGFMKPDLFIGIEHIHNFGIDSVFLNRVPYQKIKGLKVLNHEGDLIGYVEDVIIEKHNIENIVVRKNKLSTTRNVISHKHIDVIKDEVILKKGFDVED